MLLYENDVIRFLFSKDYFKWPEQASGVHSRLAQSLSVVINNYPNINSEKRWYLSQAGGMGGGWTSLLTVCCLVRTSLYTASLRFSSMSMLACWFRAMAWTWDSVSVGVSFHWGEGRENTGLTTIPIPPKKTQSCFGLFTKWETVSFKFSHSPA